MDVREKLALSVCNATQKTNYKCDFNCEKKGKCAYCLVMAEQMIAHGVTVQEWISVNDRLPEPETDVIAFIGDYIDILSYRYDRKGNLAFMYMDDSGWWHERIRPSVTYWMPLPQPPKGE